MFVRQSTVCSIRVGPLLDPADAVTAVTVVDPLAVSSLLSKNAVSSALPLVIDSNFTHDADGYWKLDLTTGNTDTRGAMVYSLTGAAFLPVWVNFEVLHPDLYDAWDQGKLVSLLTSGFTTLGTTTLEDTLRWMIAYIKGKVQKVSSSPLTYAIFDDDEMTELFRLVQSSSGREEL